MMPEWITRRITETLHGIIPHREPQTPERRIEVYERAIQALQDRILDEQSAIRILRALVAGERECLAGSLIAPPMITLLASHPPPTPEGGQD